MGTVDKDAIVRVVAERAGVSQVSAKAVIEAFTDHVTTAAEQGDTIRLRGFGSFSVKARAARNGRNPATGETMRIPENRRLVFKAAKKA